MSQSFPPMPEPGPRDPSVVVYHESPKRGLPVWAWVVIVLVILGGMLTVAICGGLIWLGARSPDTAVVPGRQVPARYVKEIRDLGLLEADEQILYFYSDGLLDIKEGMYFFTDRRLVVYSEVTDPPEIIVPLAEITDIGADFSDSWIIDGSIYLTLEDGSEVWFPVSAEAGGDQKFHDSLKRAWQKAREAGGHEP